MTTSLPPNDTVPASVRALVALFQESLQSIAFPDVDTNALTSSLAKVDDAQAHVTRLDDELAQARAALETSRDELLKLSARAHSYARVYSEDDEPLRARLDEIVLPRAKSKVSSANAQQRPAAATNANANADAADATSGDSRSPAGAAASSKRKKKREEDTSLFTDESGAGACPRHQGTHA